MKLNSEKRQLKKQNKTVVVGYFPVSLSLAVCGRYLWMQPVTYGFSRVVYTCFKSCWGIIAFRLFIYMCKQCCGGCALCCVPSA